MDRRQAFEKCNQPLVNRNTSPLSPEWMQRYTQYPPDKAAMFKFKKTYISKPFSRVENNRIALFDALQPVRDLRKPLQSTNSIFKENVYLADKWTHQKLTKSIIEGKHQVIQEATLSYDNFISQRLPED
jgi:hypothetical protein